MLLSISCSPLGSLRSLFANAHIPANAGVVFNGCAVVCCGSFGSSGRHQEPGRVAASTVPSWEPGHRSPGDHQRQPSRGHPTDEQARNADTMPEIVPNIGTQGHRRPATGFLLSRLPSYPPVTQRAREGAKIALSVLLAPMWHGCSPGSRRRELYKLYEFNTHKKGVPVPAAGNHERARTAPDAQGVPAGQNWTNWTPIKKGLKP